MAIEYKSSRSVILEVFLIEKVLECQEKRRSARIKVIISEGSIKIHLNFIKSSRLNFFLLIAMGIREEGFILSDNLTFY